MSTIIKKKEIGFEAVPHKTTLKSQSTKHVSYETYFCFVIFFFFFVGKILNVENWNMFFEWMKRGLIGTMKTSKCVDFLWNILSGNIGFTIFTVQFYDLLWWCDVSFRLGDLFSWY